MARKDAKRLAVGKYQKLPTTGENTGEEIYRLPAGRYLDNEEGEQLPKEEPSDHGPAIGATARGRGQTPSKDIATWKWWILTPSAIIAVLIDLLYQYFAHISNVNATMTYNKKTKQNEGALYDLVNGWGGNPESGSTYSFLKNFPYALLIFVFLNMIGDETAVDPVQNTHDILANKKTMKDMIAGFRGVGNTQDEKLSYIETHFNWAQKNMPTVFLWLNRFLILFFNYVVLSAADGIAVADMSGNSKGAILGSTIAAAIFGSLYYILATDNGVKEHAIEFMTRVFSGKKEDSILLNAAKNPSKTFEALCQIISNMAFRGAASSYMMFTLINLINIAFTGNPYTFDGPAAAIVYLPGIFTAYTTAFSRGLRSIKPIFKKEANNQYQAKAALPICKTVCDLSFVTLRSICAAYLTYSQYDGDPRFRSFVTLLTAFLIEGLGVRAIYLVNHNDAALELQHQGLSNQNVVTEKPILNTKTSEELFDLTANSKKPAQEIRIWIVNIGARITRQYAFIGFIWSLVNKFLKQDLDYDMDMNPLDIFALAFLFGPEVQKNDARFYQALWVEAWANWATRYEIWRYGKTHGGFASTTGQGREPLGYLEGTKVHKLLLAAKADFKPEHLEEVARNLGLGR